MTVCIGAISPPHGAIVAVSDMMLSSDEMSADSTAVKFASIFKGGKWWCMFAGDPTDFIELQGRLTAAAPRTLAGAMAAVERAYDALTRHHIERQILSPFGMTHGKFISDGASIFGKECFEGLLSRCAAVEVETDLLVMGFDAKGRPHIFETSQNGVCTVFDHLRIHAIGTGAAPALASLDNRRESLRGSPYLSHIVYRLCEAKFLSEIARSVGPKRTIINVFFEDGQALMTFENEDNPIRAAWMKQRDLPIPIEALQYIDSKNDELMTRLPEFGQPRKAYPARSKP